MKNTTATQITLPQPFTLEQLREDILNIYLLQLRTTCFIANFQKVWALTNKNETNEYGIWDAYKRPKDLDLAYADIQDSILAQTLEQQFSFGFLGFDNLLSEAMERDSMHTWIAAYLADLNSSAVMSEWHGHGADIDVSRCIYTCELANARNILEGGENFILSFGRKDDEENNAVHDLDDALTVHQMALLSGMEEMTIRTAISRKSANQLPAFKDNRRTLIKISDAKNWLIAKDRYVSVTRQTIAGADLHLEKKGFSSVHEFAHSLLRRISYLAETYPKLNVSQQLQDAASNMGIHDINFMHRETLLNTDLMTNVAEILQLPIQLLVLRAKEAVQQEDLAQTILAVNEVTAQLRSA